MHTHLKLLTIARSLALLTIVVLVGRCSWLEGTRLTSDRRPVVGSAQFSGGNKRPIAPKVTLNTAPKLDSAEIIWQISSERIDSYVIRYGLKKTALDREVKVLASELVPSEDPNYGIVNRYTLKEIPTNHPIYVTVVAVRDGIESDPSPIFEVPVAPLIEEN